MAVFDKIQNIMDKTIAPVASKVADSKMLDALMGGMMCTLPMTLGVSVIAILINFPILNCLPFLGHREMGGFP